MSREKTKPKVRRARLPSHEESRELGEEEGRAAMQKTIETMAEQMRADARSIQTAADIIDAAPIGGWPTPMRQNVVSTLRGFSDGMRRAADMLPDSRIHF